MSIESCPTTAGIVLALYATRGLDRMLSESIESILRLGIEPEQIVVGCPEDALGSIRSITRKLAPAIRVVADREADANRLPQEEYASFGSRDFRMVSWRKISFVRQVLGQHDHVIYADLDIVWIRNPIPYLSRVASRYSLAFQTEGLERFPPALCCGFFSLKRCERTLIFMDTLIAFNAAQVAGNEPIDDQAACQLLIENDPSWLKDIYFLPESLFLNGLSYRNLVSRLNSPSKMEGELSAFLFHANWTIGLENKQKLLMAARNWLDGIVPGDRTSTVNAPRPSEPRLSVLLPLGDARIDPVGNVAAWTDGQFCNPSDFEIVAVADDKDPDMVREIARILRPHDKMLSCPESEHFMSRLARAADHATGDILFLAEHHSLPDAGCVSAIVDYFDARKSVHAAALVERQQPIVAKDELNRQWFAEMNLLSRRTFGWPKLKAGSCAIRKDQFAELGGLDGSYGLFADRLLTLKAAIAGKIVGQIAVSGLSHLAPPIHEHQQHIVDYATGECLYRATNDAAFCERYLGHEHVWANRQRLDTSAARATAAMLARVLGVNLLRMLRNPRSLRGTAALAGELAQSLSLGLFGPRAMVALAGLSMRWSQWRATYPGGNLQKRWVHYRRAWERAIYYVRLNYATNHRERSSIVAMTPDLWRLSEIPETQRVGFHGHEEFKGTSFRWIEPVARLRIARSPGNTRVFIETLPIRGGDPRYVAGVFWDKRRIRHIEVTERGIGFEIEVASPLPQWLTIISYPLAAPNDERKLGIPMRSLSFASRAQ